MERKWIHILFAAAFIVAFYLFTKTGEWVWGFFAKPKMLLVYPVAFVVAGGGVLLAWRSEELFTLASECITELAKVTWPTRKETMAATLVVIVTVIIASSFLGMFDGLWSYLTRLIYG